MSSILTSLGRTVLAGFVLTLLIVVLFGSNVGSPGWVAFLFRSRAGGADAPTSLLQFAGPCHQ